LKTLVRNAAAISLLALSAAAGAQTASDTFLVTANVANSCSVTATDLAFGTYDPFAAGPTDGSSAINVTCTNGGTYAVSINGGPSNRSMAGPLGSTLTYSLFSDSGRTTAFGLAGQVGTGSAIAHNVYGRVPAGQTSARAGNYSETVTVTVSY
jgi:spore coat protein U-like protein